MESNSNGNSPLLGKSSEKRTNLQDVSGALIEQSNSSISVRDPYLLSTNTFPSRASQEDIKNLAQYSRYRYYTKLHNQPGKPPLIIPDHVLPRQVFWPHLGDKGAKQSSLITIFAIWNTMMGTSLLSLPWGIQQSGFAFAVILLVAMTIVCLYTCLLIVRSAEKYGSGESLEFIDICDKELGTVAKYVALIFGVGAFLGAIMVYWVLMSNFMFRVGKFAHEDNAVLSTNMTYQVLCPQPSANTTHSHTTKSSSSSFYKFWDQQKTVPFFLVALLLPLSSLKSPTFFTKFNALGTISVMYILVFVTVKSSQWGVHLHFTSAEAGHAKTKMWSSNFPALAGILALALYIHNAILSILATNKNQKNNKRDVGIAYVLTSSTYCFVGMLFFVCFPLEKSCIQQVFLDNFLSSDIMTVVAQCGLLFQMTTVFPLLMYIVRMQVFGAFMSHTNYSYLSIFIFNVAVIALAVLMAVFYPNVGHIIRFVGSFSGMAYIFTLPPLVAMLNALKTEHSHSVYSRLKTWLSIGFHCFLMVVGLLNLISQFLVKE